MIFQTKNDAVFTGYRKKSLDTISRPGKPLRTRNLWETLATKNPANRTLPAQPAGHFNLFNMRINHLLTNIGIGMRKIRRATKHGHCKPSIMNCVCNLIDVIIVKAGKKTIIHLKAICIEVLRHLYPLKNSHLPSACNSIEITFRKSGNFQWHN